ncbi:MAG: endonuclease/exonuclease/phosphatase family protein [Bacteroidia bacterium]
MRKKYILITISFLLGIPNMAATGLSLLHFEYWWIRIFDYPKLQMIVFMGIALLLYLVATRGGALGAKIYPVLLSVTIIYQLIKIQPYTYFSKLEVLPAEKNDSLNYFSIVHCNVLMTNRDSEKCLREITKYHPDLILAVETDTWWQNALKPLEKEYPYIAFLPLENTYGMLVYSKLKMENADFRYLVENDIPSLNPVITLRSGVKVNCYFIHPKPPAPAEAPSSINRDAELVIVAKSARNSTMPVIAAGDLNDVGWSRTSELFQKISGLLDPRIGRGLFATFNANNKFFRWPLDHIFLSKAFRVVNIQMLDDTGSDHFPIYVKLSYEPETAYEQKNINPDKKDLKDAQKKLDKAK